MINKLNSILNFLDIGDLRFLILVVKKNLKNLLLLTLLISILVFIISLNLEKKYISEATIVISPEENNIVNIEEVYALDTASRINNQITILKTMRYLNIQLQIKIGYNLKIYIQTENLFQRIFKKIVDIGIFKSTLIKIFCYKCTKK